MFIEALLGSGLSSAIALNATAEAFKEESLRSGINVQSESTARIGVQKELLDRAIKAIGTKKYEEAIPLLIRAIKLDSYYPPYYSSLGNCYLNLRQFDNALECYDKTLDLEGKVYVTTDDFRKAVRELSKECEKQLKATNSVSRKGNKPKVNKK